LFRLVAAFIEQRTWKQADLARHVGTTTETIRHRLRELEAAGFKLEKQDEPPNVYWSVPKNWMPGALAFKASEVKDLLRLVARSPKDALRDRVIETVLSRVAGDFDPGIVKPAGISDDESAWLALLEDAASSRAAVKMRYFSASRGKESWRHVSVHRVDVAAKPQFLATCHRADELRLFRVANVLEARLDRGETFRPTTHAAMTKFDRESFSGFRDDGPLVHCAFVVRDPEAAWIAKNLPDPNIRAEPAPHGTRFTVDTPSIGVLARFVTGLGDIAHAETPELRRAIAALAAGALGNAT
jgi:predicted DNA-binding transcriptional regulator YafY